MIGTLRRLTCRRGRGLLPYPSLRKTLASFTGSRFSVFGIDLLNLLSGALAGAATTGSAALGRATGIDPSPRKARIVYEVRTVHWSGTATSGTRISGKPDRPRSQAFGMVRPGIRNDAGKLPKIRMDAADRLDSAGDRKATPIRRLAAKQRPGCYPCYQDSSDVSSTAQVRSGQLIGR